MQKLIQLACTLIIGSVLGFVLVRNALSMLRYLWSWIAYLLGFFSRDLIVTVVWFGIGCGHVYFSYSCIIFDKPHQNNISDAIDEYEMIEDDKKILEGLVKDYFEEKIRIKNITDPQKIEHLKSRTL